MVVKVNCPHCDTAYRVPGEKSGAPVQFACKRCGHSVTAPIATDVTPSSVPPQSRSSQAGAGQEKMPAKIGRYLIQGRLGSGGMGVVWLGHDPGLQRDVAIKTWRTGDARDAQYRERFLREARLAAKLQDQHTVTIYEIGTDGSLAYIAMEYVDGRSLEQAVRQDGRLTWREATRAIRDAAIGLGVAHDAGVVHRDIKPSNLMQTRKGAVKVADFGLAKVQSSNSQLTQQGMILGTTAYLAPECWAGQEADARSDLYGLVCSYYYLLTARPPYVAPEVAAVGFQHRYEPLPDPRQWAPELSDGVCRILLRGLAKEPGKRYQAAGELQAELEKLLSWPDRFLGGATAWERLGGTLVQRPTPTAVEAKDAAAAGAKSGWTQQLARVRTMAWPAITAARRALQTRLGQTTAGISFFVLFVLIMVVYFGTYRGTPSNSVPVLPGPAVFSITVEPMGATLTCSANEVHVQGSGFNRTVTFSEPDGQTSFLVRAELAGYEAQEQEVIPMPGATSTLTFRLKPMPAVCLVRIDPPGAALIAGASGVNIEGNGPDRTVTFLEPGGQMNFLLRVELAGYETQEQEVTPTPGMTSRLTFGLKPTPAVYLVTVEPPGAAVTVSGSDASIKGSGSNRTVTFAEPDGQTRFLLRVELAGYEPQEQEVLPTPGITSRLTFGLRPMPAAYLLMVDPPTAAVTAIGSGVNIEGSGSARRITVSEPDAQSAVRIEATLPGYESWAHEIVPQPGGSDRLQIRLSLRREFTNSVGMTLVLIPAGEFLMGSPQDEPGRNSDELQHRVRISRPFYMGATEVTQGQYERVMGVNPSRFKTGPNHPVERVPWADAVEFCRRLSAMEGGTYRLPTEAEWEYACRAGTTTAWCFGDEQASLNEYCWYAANAGQTTHPVAQKKANAWGLYDMHGNVWEWCSDRYGPYETTPVNDPQGPSRGFDRVIRGGSWGSRPEPCRSANRISRTPRSMSDNRDGRAKAAPRRLVPFDHRAVLPHADPGFRVTFLAPGE